MSFKKIKIQQWPKKKIVCIRPGAICMQIHLCEKLEKQLQFANGSAISDGQLYESNVKASFPQKQSNDHLLFQLVRGCLYDWSKANVLKTELLIRWTELIPRCSIW